MFMGQTFSPNPLRPVLMGPGWRHGDRGTCLSHGTCIGLPRSGAHNSHKQQPGSTRPLILFLHGNRCLGCGRAEFSQAALPSWVANEAEFPLCKEQHQKASLHYMLPLLHTEKSRSPISLLVLPSPQQLAWAAPAAHSRRVSHGMQSPGVLREAGATRSLPKRDRG